MNEMTVIPRGELAVRSSIPAMSAEAIDKVRAVEDHVLAMPQVSIFTEHVLHAGIYSRTIMIPAGVVITGALVKIPTQLIIDGHVLVYIGDDAPLQCQGHAVLAASAGRKQVFAALADTWLTMIFAFSVPDVEAAERHFTDEFKKLGSHRDPALNRTTITGE